MTGIKIAIFIAGIALLLYTASCVADYETEITPQKHEFSFQKTTEIHPVDDKITSADFSSDGSRLLLGTKLGNICIYDRNTDTRLFNTNPFSPYLRFSVLSGNGELIVAHVGEMRKVEVWSTSTMQQIAKLDDESWGDLALCFSPDNKILATINREVPVYIKFWSIETGAIINITQYQVPDYEDDKHKFPPYRKFSGNSKRFFFASSTVNNPNGYQLLAYDLQERKVISRLPYDDDCTLNHDGTRMAHPESRDGKIINVFDVDSEKLIFKKPFISRASIRKPSIGPNGNRIFLISDVLDREKKVEKPQYSLLYLDVRDGNLKLLVKGYSDYIFSPDGRLLLARSSQIDESRISLWDISGQDIKPIIDDRIFKCEFRNMVFSPDSTVFSLVEYQQYGISIIRLFSVETGEELKNITLNTYTVNNLKISGDKKTVVTSYKDKDSAPGYDSGSIHVLSMDSGDSIREITNTFTDVFWVRFNADDSRIAALGSDRSLSLLSAEDGSVIRTELIDYEGFTYDCIDIGKNLLAIRYDRNTVKIYNINTLEAVASLDIDDEIQTVKMASDDETLICFHGRRAYCSPSGGGEIKFWSVKTGELLRTIGGDFGAFASFALSPDDSLIATTGPHSVIRIYDLKTGLDYSKNCETGHGYVLFFNPSGNLVITIENSIQFTESETAEKMGSFYTGNGRYFLAFDPSSNGFLIAGDDGLIEFWSINEDRNEL